MPEDRICLQILYTELPNFSGRDLDEIASHVSHRPPTFTYQLPDQVRDGAHGLASTSDYKIRLDYHDHKLSDRELAQISAHVRLVPDADANINQHASYIEISVDQNQANPLQAYQTLTFLGLMLSTRKGLVLANVNGFTSFSSDGLQQIMGDEDWMDAIENMPPLFLYSGPVIHEFDNNEMLWMRSYGNHLFGIPDLGTAFSSHIVQQYVPMTLTVFDNIMSYMIETGTQVTPGDTMESETVVIAMKEQPAKPDEYFYQSPTGMLRVEYSPKPGVQIPNL